MVLLYKNSENKSETITCISVLFKNDVVVVTVEATKSIEIPLINLLKIS